MRGTLHGELKMFNIMFDTDVTPMWYLHMLPQKTQIENPEKAKVA